MAAELAVDSLRRPVAPAALPGYAVVTYVFLSAPIVLLVLFSFDANRYGRFPITGWTLEWCRTAINDYQLHDAVWTPFRIALQVPLISTVFGTAAAFPLARARL